MDSLITLLLAFPGLLIIGFVIDALTRGVLKDEDTFTKIGSSFVMLSVAFGLFCLSYGHYLEVVNRSL